MANIQFIADNSPSNSENRTFFGIDLGTLRAVYGYALTCHKSQGGEWNYVGKLNTII